MEALFSEAARLLTDSAMWQAFGQIAVVDAILSFDNIAVILALVAAANIKDPKVRQNAILAGVACAVIIRFGMAGAYGFLTGLGPLALGAMFVGGALWLLRSTYKMWFHDAAGVYKAFPGQPQHDDKKRDGFWAAVTGIAAIDFIASLDNVLVAGMYATQFGHMIPVGAVAGFVLDIPTLLVAGIVLSGIMLVSGLWAAQYVEEKNKNKSASYKQAAMFGLYATAGLLLAKVAFEMLVHGGSMLAEGLPALTNSAWLASLPNSAWLAQNLSCAVPFFKDAVPLIQSGLQSLTQYLQSISPFLHDIATFMGSTLGASLSLAGAIGIGLAITWAVYRGFLKREFGTAQKQTTRRTPAPATGTRPAHAAAPRAFGTAEPAMA